MYLSYNGYAHADNEVWFNITKRATYSPQGLRERMVERWDIRGVLTGDDESDLTSKMQALSNAYSVNGGDLQFIGNSGQLTHHALFSSNTLNGTRIEKFDWLPGNPGIWGSGTEYVAKRSYQITVTAETLINSGNLYLYRATLSAMGTCGPRKIWMPSLTGIPQMQIVRAYTTQRIHQSGTVVGLTGYEFPDSPLFPEYEHLDRRQVNKLSPQEVNQNQSLKYPVTWNYFFESPVPLVAV